MSKYIPPKGNKDYSNQKKAKLAIKVMVNEEEVTLDEYDLAALQSDLMLRMNKLEQIVKGIIDGMNAATGDVSLPGQAPTQKAPAKPTLKLPKLKKVKSEGLSSDHIYPNSADSVTLQS